MSFTPERFRKQISRFIQAQNLLQYGQGVIVACSGGPDSMALLHVLFRLGYAVQAAHVNHGLRGSESDADESLVRDWCTEKCIICHVLRAKPEEWRDRQADSLQIAARKLRKGWLQQLMAKQSISQTATAHHRNDQAETLLLHLFRGKNTDILRGIPVEKNGFVRPFLETPAEILHDYLAAENVPFRIDASNLTNDYLRNRIRNVILPALREINPRIEAHLCERLQDYRLQFDVLSTLLIEIESNTNQVSDKDIGNESRASEAEWPLPAEPNPADRLRLLMRLEQELHLRPTEAQRVANLMNSKTGAKVETALGTCWRTRTGLRWTQNPEEQAIEEQTTEIAIDLDALPQTFDPFGQRIDLYSHALSSDSPLKLPPPAGTHYIDRGRLQGQLVLRAWRAGEKMQPLGMRGRRLVSDLLTDIRFPTERRKQALVLADDSGTVWVEGFRIAERVKLLPESEKVLVLTLGGKL